MHNPVACHRMCHLVGRLLAKALLDRQLVTLPLNRPLLKHILGVPVTLSDLEFVDEAQLKMLRDMLGSTGEVEEMYLDFTEPEEIFGVMHTVELKPGGGEIALTDENKIECVQRFHDARVGF